MKNRLWDEYTEEQIWELYRSTNENCYRDAIVEKYAPLVKYVAGKIAMKLPASIEFDDLVGYGIFGLFDAIKKYEPSKGNKFNTYATLRINGTIIDELRAIDRVPRTVRKMAKQIETATAELESRMGRAVTEAEVARELGITQDELSKKMLNMSGLNVLSLNDLWFSGDENDKVSLLDSIESSPKLNPDYLVGQAEVKRVIEESIAELPENIKQVIILYYYEDLTLREIGKILKVTESRVSQLHTKATNLLKIKLTNIKKGIF